MRYRDWPRARLLDWRADGHRDVLRYAVPFLLHWVAKDDRFDAFLAPGAALPGVLFTADVDGAQP